MIWTHLGDTQPISCVPRLCSLCEQTIAAGERHVYRRGIRGGEFIVTRMHERCEVATHDWDHTDWESFDVAEFREALRLDAAGEGRGT